MTTTHRGPVDGPAAAQAAGRRTAVVVGGGLAGTTAALALADAGLRVVLTEARPRLGGLAFSFKRGELTVDNGQHVFLRCCTAYQWFLDRIAARDLVTLQDRLDVPVFDADTGRTGRIGRAALPVPLHLASSLLRYPHLSLRERGSVGRAALALRALDPADPALDRTDFGSWLTAHGQSARTVEALWDLVAIATLNARSGQSSLGLAAMVFKTGLLSEPGAADIGWASAPLGDLHDGRARTALDAAGVRTLLRTRTTAIEAAADGGWQIEVETGPGRGEQLTADTVVLAVPQREAHGLLPEGALEEPETLLRIGTSPILNVHVIYDRQVLDRPFVTALGSPVQWVFDRTGSSGLTGGGQYLAVSQSAAQDEIDLPVARLRDRYLPELARVLPAARDAQVRDFFVTRERTATFAPTPGVGALRPGPVTRAPGLFLAGAWTATGWPATMESAVRSGLQASREAVVRPRTYRPQRRPGGGMSAIGATRGENVTADSVIALLENGRILTTPVLRAAVARLAPPMDTVASYHFGWIDQAGRPADGDGGKAVRPALALLSAQAAGAPAEVGVPGAVAVELAHNFSLLHDDLMDGDEKRRHRDTVWKIHGPAQAILVGDALFALANEVLLEQGTAQRGPRHPPADRRHPQTDRRSGPGHLLRAPRAGHRPGVPGDGGQQDRLAAGLRLLHRRGARRRLRGGRRRAGGVRLPPRARLPGDRRPAGHLGRPGEHRQADLERPAAAQEVPSGGRRAGRRRPRVGAAG